MLGGEIREGLGRHLTITVCFLLPVFDHAEDVRDSKRAEEGLDRPDEFTNPHSTSEPQGTGTGKTWLPQADMFQASSVSLYHRRIDDMGNSCHSREEWLRSRSLPPRKREKKVVCMTQLKYYCLKLYVFVVIYLQCCAHKIVILITTLLKKKKAWILTEEALVNEDPGNLVFSFQLLTRP